MLIERIEIFHVAMPLIYPWRTAYGEDASIESLLIKVSSEDQYDIPVTVNPASFTNLFIDHPEWESSGIAKTR